MIRVKFDSNVWRLAARPARFPKDPAFSSFARIHQEICDGTVEARISETIFTLEGISRAGRREFFSKYRPRRDVQVTPAADGGVRVSIRMGPNAAAHPGSNSFLTSHLVDALQAGFRLIRCPRIAGVKNPDLKAAWFDQEPTGPRVEASEEVACRIEAVGAGCAVAEQIGARYAGPDGSWFLGLGNAPAGEEAAIAAAVAEWADGDSIVAHVAYGNHFFCTRDRALSAGPTSVLSASNRAWLEQDYGVKFVLPEELVAGSGKPLGSQFDGCVTNG